MADSWLKAGDSAPRLQSTLQDRDGVPVDISDADVLLFVKAIHGETVIDGDAASNDQVGDGSDGTAGMVSFEFDGPLDAGGYRYEWQVTFADTSVETFPNDGWLTLAVVSDLEAVGS